ncbi:hypothetical protein FB451DRAFT_1207856 [Mycena latifolia]|nr:hypothetical protein FB451DRAFT_1207856 [Mycena latifolia]
MEADIPGVPMESPQISERFCAPDTDMTVSSSDGVLFKPENGDELVHLSESSDVLDLLFQYMYRQPQPNLEAVDFPIVAGVAEAAEKYMVYSALPACRTKMKDSILAHPLEVLTYAVKHNHNDLANESARQSMGLGVADAMQILPSETFKAWVRPGNNEYSILFKGLHVRRSCSMNVGTRERCALSSVWWVSGAANKCLRDPNPLYTYRKDLPDWPAFRHVLRMEFISSKDTDAN